MKIVHTHTISLILISTFLLSSCTHQQDTTEQPIDSRTKPNIENKHDLENTSETITPQKTMDNSVNYKDNFGLELRNNEITFYGKKRGWISGNRIYISFQNNIYSFEFQDGIDKLSFHEMEGFESVIYYNGLTINLPDEQGIYDPKIAYNCDTPLLRGQPYEYCQTNGTNMLDQYEFGGAYRQFSTGGGHGLCWSKIFIQKIDDKNIIFEGGLVGSICIDSDQSFRPEETLPIYQSLLQYNLVDNLGLNAMEKDTAKISEKLEPIHLKMRNIIGSKQYLDKLKDNSKN